MIDQPVNIDKNGYLKGLKCSHCGRPFKPPLKAKNYIIYEERQNKYYHIPCYNKKCEIDYHKEVIDRMDDKINRKMGRNLETYISNCGRR